MFYQRVLVCALVLACAALSGCGGGGGTTAAFTSPVAPPTGSLTIKLALFGFMPTGSAALMQRYGVYQGGEHNQAQMRAFKAANPTGTTLLYQMAGAATQEEWARTTPNDPIGYYWIDQNRPEWFLVDSAGNRISYENYPTIWAIDPGNEEYQRMWAEKAIERARRIGADGIKIDAVNSRFDWNHSALPAKYPTQSDYARAMDAFVRAVVPVIRQAGLIVIGNGSGEPWNNGAWAEWINLFDGREQETISTFVAEPLWRDFLDSYQALPDKLYVYYLPDPDQSPDLFRYNVATYLLYMGPNSYASLPYNYGPEPKSHPLLDLAIGRPTGPCQQIGSVTYRRTFEYGQVILNVSAASSETVQVEPGYRDATQGPVAAGAVTLAPRQSLILVRE